MKRFNKILCVVNADEQSEAAVLQAKQVAQSHQADITFASVVSIPSAWQFTLGGKADLQQEVQEAVNNKQAALQAWLKQVDASLSGSIEVYTGTGFIELIKSVTKNQFDLVIKCADDPDWLGRLFGSDDMHLIRKCPCAVLMLKPGHLKPIRSILATVDVNHDVGDGEQGQVQEQLNRKVLEYSASLGLSELTDLHIASVWEAFYEDFYRYSAFSQMPKEKVDRYVEQGRKQCADKLDLLVNDMTAIVGEAAMQFLQPRAHLIKGQPHKEIPLIANSYNVDLVVMGTVGRVGVPGFFIGNTAESILEQVQCSVLTLKPDGFVTPVV